MSTTETDLQGAVEHAAAHWNSLYHDVQTEAKKRLEEIFARL